MGTGKKKELKGGLWQNILKEKLLFDKLIRCQKIMEKARRRG